MPASRRVCAALLALLVLTVVWTSPVRAQVQVIDMIPNAMSGETNVDNEPFIAVNPANYQIMVATPFMLQPAGSANGPMLVSFDGGTTWVARNIIPSNTPSGIPNRSFGDLNSYDITVQFNSAGTALYAGILRNPTVNLEVLRTTDMTLTTPMTVLLSQSGHDQPYIAARTVTGWFDAGKDRAWVSTNTNSGGAKIDQSLDVGITTPVFSQVAMDAALTSFGDNYQTRTAAAADGHVYAVFYRLKTARRGATTNTVDVVVIRDDNWGMFMPPFGSLVDSMTMTRGQNVVVGSAFSDSAGSSLALGNEWWGGDLAITVDPRDASRVYVLYQDSVSADNTGHLRRSTDFGQTWGPDLLTTSVAKNSSIAVNSQGRIAFVYQQIAGTSPNTRWQTHLRRSADGTTWDDVVLSDFPAEGAGAFPDPTGSGRIVGDYMRVVAAGKNFYGVFSAYNSLASATFPAGVTWQRNQNGTNFLDTDNVTVVQPSIDAFLVRSIEMNPAIDFYVRDWTDNAATFDHGAEPSVRSDFFSTSDVWNRRSNDPLPFDANDRPQSEDPQPMSMGTNFAFSRVSREVAGGAATVSLQYLLSDGGVGVNYVSAGAATTLALAAADTQQTPDAGAGFLWNLPSGASNHVCLAVEISTATDPIIAPSLLGRAPGWPTTDLSVVNDNNKAQRNLQVFGFAGATPSSPAMAMNAEVHNAATVTRDLQLGIDVAPGDLGRFTAGTLRVLGTSDTQPISEHGLLTLRNMSPGESRWVELAFTPAASARGPLPIRIVELRDGQPINGYAYVPTQQPLSEAIRQTLTQDAAVFFRLADAFDIPGAREHANRAFATVRLSSLHRGKSRARTYERFLRNNAATIAELSNAFIDVSESDVFGVRAASDAFLAAANSAYAAQPPHLTLLGKLDGAQSELQKSGGEIGDIPQNVRWQADVFVRLGTQNVAGATDVVTKSRAFLTQFESRQIGVEGFDPLLRSLRASFNAAAGRDPTGRAGRLLTDVWAAQTPAALQKNHRQFLLAIQDPVVR